MINLKDLKDGKVSEVYEGKEQLDSQSVFRLLSTKALRQRNELEKGRRMIKCPYCESSRVEFCTGFLTFDDQPLAFDWKCLACEKYFDRQ